MFIEHNYGPDVIMNVSHTPSAFRFVSVPGVRYSPYYLPLTDYSSEVLEAPWSSTS